MQTSLLTLATFEKVAPDAATDFQKLLVAAVLDCKERPQCDKVRKVILTLSISPRPSDPDDVIIEPLVTTATPARVHDCFVGRTTKTGQLIFDFLEQEGES